MKRDGSNLSFRETKAEKEQIPKYDITGYNTNIIGAGITAIAFAKELLYLS